MTLPIYLHLATIILDTTEPALQAGSVVDALEPASRAGFMMIRSLTAGVR